jgi:hypothetical protein
MPSPLFTCLLLACSVEESELNVPLGHGALILSIQHLHWCIEI